MTDADAQKLTQEFADKLGEQFEAVLILTSDSESDVTSMNRAWSGNYYAAKGMAQEFIDTPPTEPEAEPE